MMKAFQFFLQVSRSGKIVWGLKEKKHLRKLFHEEIQMGRCSYAAIREKLSQDELLESLTRHIKTNKVKKVYDAVRSLFT